MDYLPQNNAIRGIIEGMALLTNLSSLSRRPEGGRHERGDWPCRHYVVDLYTTGSAA